MYKLHRFLALAGALGGCNPNDTGAVDSDSGSGSGGAASSSSSTGDAPPPTTGETGTGTGSGGVEETGETTGVASGAARVFYMVQGEGPFAHSLRSVEVDDAGQASAPVTVLAAPPGQSLWYADESADRRWILVAGQSSPALWVVDTWSAVASPVPVPPTLESVGARFSPDSKRLVLSGPSPTEADAIFQCVLADDGACALELVESAGVMSTRIFPPIDAVSGQSKWLAFVRVSDFASELMLIELDTPGPAQVLASFPGGLFLTHLRWSDDEQILYFTADPDDEQVEELVTFAVDLGVDPPGPPIPLHLPRPGGGIVTWAPDNRAFLLWSRDGGHGELELVRVDGLAASAPERVNSQAAPGHVSQSNTYWDHDSARVVFEADHESPGRDQIYLVDVKDGLSAPLKVHAPIPDEAYVALAPPPFMPQPGRLLFHLRPTPTAMTGLMSASTDPVGDVVLLNPGTSYRQFQGYSADGARLGYLTIQDNLRDLYVVGLTDGPQPAQRVNGAAPVLERDGPLTSVASFSSDGHRVFFRIGVKDVESRLASVALGPDGPLGEPLVLSGADERVQNVGVFPGPE